MNANAPISALEDIPAVLLVGGMGTRLRPVISSTPKPMALVGDKSFLELLIWQLRGQGIRRLVLCSGYLADQIESKFGDGSAWGVKIQHSREQDLLGTAGALNLAKSYVQNAAQIMVMNGDSFLEADFSQLFRLHRERKGLATLAVVPVQDAGRYGTVKIDSTRRVTGFAEKTGANAPGLISAGVYVFERTIFDHIPEGPASLERNVFPSVLHLGVYAFEQCGLFIDIGTPEDYARAQTLHKQLSAVVFERQGYKPLQTGHR